MQAQDKHELKQEYIVLRSQGYSYRAIADKLHINKTTCSRWQKELEQEINKAREKQLSDLYNSFELTKVARVKRLGSMLGRIERALENVDLSTVPPAKLIELYLKHVELLKQEVTPLEQYTISSVDDIPKALTSIINLVRAGELTSEQAGKELAVMSDLLKAYEIIDIKQKEQELEEKLDNVLQEFKKN